MIEIDKECLTCKQKFTTTQNKLYCSKCSCVLKAHFKKCSVENCPNSIAFSFQVYETAPQTLFDTCYECYHRSKKYLTNYKKSNYFSLLKNNKKCDPKNLSRSFLTRRSSSRSSSRSPRVLINKYPSNFSDEPSSLLQEKLQNELQDELQKDEQKDEFTEDELNITTKYEALHFLNNFEDNFEDNFEQETEEYKNDEETQEPRLIYHSDQFNSLSESNSQLLAFQSYICVSPCIRFSQKSV
jgi:hypothetical protein